MTHRRPEFHETYPLYIIFNCQLRSDFREKCFYEGKLNTVRIFNGW